MRILYVEDNPANVYLVKRVARAGQHEVINYVDGGRVLRDFGQINPDLVLMDIQLVGEMSGIDVVKKLRSEGHQVPIIAVTAYAMMGDRDRCLDAGCNDYMAKPLPIPQLLEMFSKYENTAHDTAPDATTSTDTSEPVSAAPAVDNVKTPESVTPASQNSDTTTNSDKPVN
ncbi:response regulator [Phototrophicus methaneseepsis]|uniref:Response regulator n=1 Tax=Phototrophicus methaneseepsis TaxID=2710758 RepID=A0A7S8E7V8_9CHLR|nr:response regulator [Phototrophicus methaneseepsis]QPC81947.1 response regulator [Phototrophicus methaneseepsis]